MKVIATEKSTVAMGESYSQAYVNNGVDTSGQLQLILRQEILAEIQSKSRLSGLARM